MPGNADRPNRSRLRRLMRWALIAGCLTVAILAGVAWQAAGQLVAPAPRKIGPPPAGAGIEEVSFASDSGSQLAGWYQRGEPGRGVVVVLHGIHSDRKASVPRARLFADAGFSTLVFDLRCHGESPGEYVTLGVLESLDARAAVEFAKQQNPGEPVAVVGFSLGGAAIALAGPLDVDAVVLEAVFPDIETAVRNRTDRWFGSTLQPLASWALLVQLNPRIGISVDQLRPIDRVAEVGCPVLITGGDLDHQTTPDDTRRLFAAAAEPKEIAWFEGLGHNNYARWHPEKYRDHVVAFVERAIAKRKKSSEP